MITNITASHIAGKNLASNYSNIPLLLLLLRRKKFLQRRGIRTVAPLRRALETFWN